MEKIVLVTGASRGIGRNIAYNLALDGYKVIANYNNSEKEAKDLQEELKNKNIKIDIFKADISRKQEVENLVNFVIEKYNKIDVLINNAGIAEEKLFIDITEEDFDKMMKVNLYSVFYTTQELYEAQVAPCTTCAPKQVVVEQPKIVTVEQTETIEEKPVEVVPAPQPLPDKTWWETYQEEKQPVKPTVVCPCPDPNDPCPQCVTK